MTKRRVRPHMERPKTYPGTAVKSRHTPMWLYECYPCGGYTSFSGILVTGNVIHGIGNCECGGKFFPVFPHEITEFRPMESAKGDEEVTYPENTRPWNGWRPA